MPIQSASDALAHIQSIASVKPPALIRDALTNSKSEFQLWLTNERQDLSELVSEVLAEPIPSSSAGQRIQRFHDLFLAIEREGNALTDTHDFGTALCRHILLAQGLDKDVVAQFQDVVSLQKRRQFETAVCHAMPEQLAKNDDASGLRDFVAGLSTAQLSPSTKERMDRLVEALNTMETAVRYEVLARMDAYIRSGWARNDLESNDPSTQSLRDAFSAFALAPENNKNNPLIDTTITHLFTRFDQLFHKVEIRDGKAIDYGNFAHQPGYKKPTAKTTPESIQRAGKGLLDVAILCHDKPNSWIVSLVTAAKSSDRVRQEGEQYARHSAALSNWHFVDPRRGARETPQPLPSQTVEFGIVYNAMVNTNSRSKLAKQLSTELGSPVVQSINDLPLLCLVSNQRDALISKSATVTCIGAPTNMTLVNSFNSDDYSKYAAEQIITAVSGLLNASVQSVVSASALEQSMSLATSVIAMHNRNPHLLKNAPTSEWRTALTTMESQLVSGDFSSIRMLDMAITAIEHIQSKPVQDKSNGQPLPATMTQMNTLF